MVSSLLIVAGLLVTNAVVYSLLSFRVFRRMRRQVHASNLADAFHALETALKASLPDLPPGFTWEEALDRVKVRNYNRRDIEAALENYEAYRFGGVPFDGESDFSEVERVANILGGSKSGRRN
jgi:hypothetical protein